MRRAPEGREGSVGLSARTVKDPEERRAEIVEAARRLFAEKGYSGTSVSEIVKSVGVAQGTFYWYFKSKEEVYHAILYAYAEKVVLDTEELVGDPDLPASEKITRVLSSYTPSDEWDAKLVNRLHSPEEAELHDRMAREFSRKLIPVLADIVRQGIEEGLFETEYPDEAAAFMVAMGAVQDMIDISGLDRAGIARWIRAYFDFVAHGLGYSGGSSLEPNVPHSLEQ